MQVSEDTSVADRVRRWAAGRRVVIAGSTHEGEEPQVIEAWSALDPRPLLVIAPRRPERFGSVFEILVARGIRAARSSAEAKDADAVVLDTVGELASAYGAADVAFIGGTLVPVGGHNPIEAWAHGVPTILGPHTRNFGDIVGTGIAREAAVTVRDAAELATALRRLLNDADARASSSRNARALVEMNGGAARAAAQAVLPLRKIA